MNLTLTERIERLEKAVFRKTQTWVKSSVIMEVTGWDKKDMYKARQQNLIKWKKENGFWYLLESIPAIFIKNLENFPK
jgi:hypothetical protein